MFDFSSFRKQNISRNTELLLATDIHKLPSAPSPASKSPRKPKEKTQVHRKSISSSALPDATPDVQAEARDKAGLRSSSRVRNQGLDAEKKKEEDKKLQELRDAGDDEEEGSYWENGKKVKTEVGYAPEKLGKRLYNPKRFGHIPGVAVGTKFNFRMEASQAAIHAPVVAGVSGSPEAGAWSIAVSGGYVDDVDLGYRLTYSGSGGRDLKGTAKQPKNLRTAPQSADQTWDGLNASLKRSVETKKPIRVLRGFKGKSAFAPAEGYRYDGLYMATKAWKDVGESGFKVCRIALVRLPGQPKIPMQKGREKEIENLKELEDGAGITEANAAPSGEDATPESEEIEQETLAATPEEAGTEDLKTLKRKNAAEEVEEKGEVNEVEPKTKRRRSTRNAQ
ncbi:YDG/SRA domain-containing protein [Sporobolomyces salmoneus]|uniref:YDG/SRA domain-containing protein n=1 Tax=Sporobolomyces salmoneus TaxID=183962 RepID=UPI00316CCDB9